MSAGENSNFLDLFVLAGLRRLLRFHKTGLSRPYELPNFLQHVGETLGAAA